jgi:hypothetical protein
VAAGDNEDRLAERAEIPRGIAAHPDDVRRRARRECSERRELEQLSSSDVAARRASSGLRPAFTISRSSSTSIRGGMPGLP